MEQPGAYAEGQTIGTTSLCVVRRLDGNRGRMAQVYLATRTARTGTPPVVVKIANVYDRHGRLRSAMLHSEAKYLAELSHPSIVRLLPALDEVAKPGSYTGETSEGGYAYLVLEHLTGGSLSELLERRRGLSACEAVAIAYALASALDYVHARGLVHLDIAPHNILLRTAPGNAALPEAVLIDFGSACRVGRQTFALHETFYASAYLPPEVLAAASTGDIAVEPKIDVYALGAVLFTMLVGEPPFEVADQRALHDAIQRGIYPSLAERWQPESNAIAPELQQRLDSMVRLAMHLEPARRCDAAWMARELYEIGYHLGLWPAASTNTGGEKSGRQRSLLIALVALGLLVFGAGFGSGVLTGSALATTRTTPPPIATPAATSTATGTATPITSPTSSAAPTLAPTNSPTSTPAATATNTPLPTATTRAPTATPAPTTPP